MSFELNDKVTSASEAEAGDSAATHWQKTQFPPALLSADNFAQRQTRLRKNMRVLRRETSTVTATSPDAQSDTFPEEPTEPLRILRDRSRDVLLAVASVGSLGWISYRWWQGR